MQIFRVETQLPRDYQLLFISYQISERFSPYLLRTQKSLQPKFCRFFQPFNSIIYIVMEYHKFIAQFISIVNEFLVTQENYFEDEIIKSVQ